MAMEHGPNGSSFWVVPLLSLRCFLSKGFSSALTKSWITNVSVLGYFLRDVVANSVCGLFFGLWYSDYSPQGLFFSGQFFYCPRFANSLYKSPHFPTWLKAGFGGEVLFSTAASRTTVRNETLCSLENHDHHSDKMTTTFSPLAISNLD